MRIAVLLALTTLFLQVKAQVVINEYSASNWQQFQDNHNDFEDWIELYNAGPFAVNLHGYHLSDNPDDLTKFTFPAGSFILPGDYLLVWCSGRDTIDDGNYHMPFRLTQTKNSPDMIVLSDLDEQIIDSVTLDITLTHHARARFPDGAAEWRICTAPTPMESNTPAPMFVSYTDRPDFSLDGGFYDTPVWVSISTTEPDAVMHYTLDGTEPKLDDPIYVDSFLVSTTTVVKARSFSTHADILPGKIQYNTYFIDVHHTLPVVSLAGDTLLELANGDQDLEPIASIEIYGADGDSKTRSYGEMNSHGQDSWANDQRSLDWVSRDEFGYSRALKEKFFAQSDREDFQRMIFRAAGDDNYPAAHHEENEGSAHLRDDYVQMLAKEDNLALDVRTSARCVVYLNGQYWGVYSFREKTDDHDFTEYYYNQGKYDIQYQMTWGNTWSEYGGSATLNAWEDLRDLAELQDMSQDTNYAEVEALLDVTSLVDYMCVNTSAVCKDWLVYNTAVWRGFNPEGTHHKWGYTLWDLDATFGFYINYSGVPEVGPTAEPCDVDEYDPDFFPPAQFDGKGHVRLLNDLRENATFEQFYLSRYTDLYNTTFSCENMLFKLDSMIAIIEPEMEMHADRWYGTYDEWYTNYMDLRGWIEERCDQLYTGMTSCYDLTGPYEVTFAVEPPEAGYLKVNTLTHTDLPWDGTYFGGMENKIIAYTNNADVWLFDHWEASTTTFSSPYDSTMATLSGDDVITAVFRLTTEVEDYSVENWSVQPTLFDQAVSVSYTLSEPAPVLLTLYTSTGESVAQLQSNAPSGNNRLSWDLETYHLPSGMYLIEMRAGDFHSSQKVIKR